MPNQKAPSAMSDQNDREGPDPRDYNQVVAQARLIAVRLISSKLQVNPTAFADEGAKTKYLIDYILIDKNYDPVAGRLVGIFNFKYYIKHGRSKSVEVVADYVIDYGVSAPCDEEAAILFVRRLGPFAAYPYFRALHAMLMGQAGLVAPPLPVLAEAPRSIDRAAKLQMQHEQVGVDH
jgi:hypothetical protein